MIDRAETAPKHQFERYADTTCHIPTSEQELVICNIASTIRDSLNPCVQEIYSKEIDAVAQFITAEISDVTMTIAHINAVYERASTLLSITLFDEKNRVRAAASINLNAVRISA